MCHRIPGGVDANDSGQRRGGERNGKGMSYSQPTTGSGERRKLPQRDLGQSPSRKQFVGVSCAILCDVTHILVHLTVVWKWQIPISVYWLVRMTFPGPI